MLHPALTFAHDPVEILFIGIEPIGQINGARNLKRVVIEALLDVFQCSPLLEKTVNRIMPKFDALVTRMAGDPNLVKEGSGANGAVTGQQGRLLDLCPLVCSHQRSRACVLAFQ